MLKLIMVYWLLGLEPLVIRLGVGKQEQHGRVEAHKKLMAFLMVEWTQVIRPCFVALGSLLKPFGSPSRVPKAFKCSHSSGDKNLELSLRR
ncbi:hypothetical protein ACOSQ2_021547 [Xanthoceras sorbifolium]